MTTVMDGTDGMAVLSIPQAARRIGVSRTTAFRWVKAGRFPVPIHRFHSGRVYVLAADLEAWVGGQFNGAA